MYSFLHDHIPSLSDSSNPANIRFKFEFPNGYAASVIKNEYSYGGSEGLWEIAILDRQGEICYDTPITDDVIGWVEESAVSEILYAIHDL